jgi:hypothetical protein
MKTAALCQRRNDIEHQRIEFDGNHAIDKAEGVSQYILNSWQRSAGIVSSASRHAPIDDEQMVSDLWRQSPLSMAAQQEQENMIQLVKEGELVAAISDPCGRLLWTHASGYMRRRAESLNFTAGGHWDEQTVGTNAVGLSLQLKRPVTVFSLEHYLPFVQDWVCYAAPIIHPQTGECVGALDISTTWNKHTPLGQSATAQLAHSIAQCLPQIIPRAEIEIHALGQPRVIYRGKEISMPPRQLEILCLLALNPDGLSLECLHSALYGDAKVSTATLKADVSHLRGQLNGQINSRPYRLAMPVWADFVGIWELLNKQDINAAMAIYRGAFLSKSESPEIIEWRYCIDAIMRQAINTYETPEMLMKKASQSFSGSALFRERIVDLLVQK